MSISKKSKYTRCYEYNIIDSIGEDHLPIKGLTGYLDMLGYLPEYVPILNVNNRMHIKFEQDLFVLYERDPEGSNRNSRDYLLHFETDIQLITWLDNMDTNQHRSTILTYVVFPGLAYAIYGSPEFKIILTGDALFKYENHFINKLQLEM